MSHKRTMAATAPWLLLQYVHYSKSDIWVVSHSKTQGWRTASYIVSHVRSKSSAKPTNSNIRLQESEHNRTEVQKLWYWEGRIKTSVSLCFLFLLHFTLFSLVSFIICLLCFFLFSLEQTAWPVEPLMFHYMALNLLPLSLIYLFHSVHVIIWTPVHMDSPLSSTINLCSICIWSYGIYSSSEMKWTFITAEEGKQSAKDKSKL